MDGDVCILGMFSVDDNSWRMFCILGIFFVGRTGAVLGSGIPEQASNTLM